MLLMLYRLDDQKLQQGVFHVKDAEEARYWNDKNWGIFFTPNTFNSEVRRIENLKRINCWYVDIDNCDNKEETLVSIMKAPMLPTVINETKSGYHLYFKSVDATVENFEEIESRLIYYYEADTAVKDIPRILRKSGYYHCKDLENKFLVKTVYHNNFMYTEKGMMLCYPSQPKVEFKEFEKIADFGNVNLYKLLKPEQILNGERNNRLFKKAVFLKRLGASNSQVEQMIYWLNERISDPLETSEVITIIRRYDKWNA
jgi:hypothetical protein